MEYLLFKQIFSFLPIFILFIIALLPSKKRSIPRISVVWPLILMLIYVIYIANYPAELNPDKQGYIRMYYNALYNTSNYEFRDPGWIVYNRICSMIFGDNIILFFYLTAFVYTGAIFFFAIRLFSNYSVIFFFVMSVGCMGFINYGTNVIRAGFALSLLLISVTCGKKKVFPLVLVLFALSIHKSMIIPIAAYFGSRILKEHKWALMFWVICLALSVANLDLGPLFETIGFVDERIESYAGTIESEGGYYEKGFRLDFLTYSIVPLILSLYYIKKIKISDKFYSSVLNTYLWANAVWLLAIRMAYSDRLAYLSWFLIPTLTLYPILKYPNKFKHPQRFILVVMLIFIGVSVALGIRSMLKTQ